MALFFGMFNSPQPVKARAQRFVVERLSSTWKQWQAPNGPPVHLEKSKGDALRQLHSLGIRSKQSSEDLLEFGDLRHTSKRGYHYSKGASVLQVPHRGFSLSSIQDIVGPLGYPLETHRCQTVDGYILELHRIPHGREEQVIGDKENVDPMGGNRTLIQGQGDQQRRPRPDSGKPRPPVLMMHGLLASSAVYVISGSHPENAIGFMFADHGYDVWLGNFRGNDYSREHVSLSPNDPEYWEFSWDEMGRYDLPAMINYVSEATGAEKIKYVGHSMGTTAFWVFGHYDAEPQAFGFSDKRSQSTDGIVHQPGSVMSKISMMIALAPVARLDHMQSPMRYLCGWTNDINAAMEAVGARGFLPSSHPAVQFVAASLLDNMNPTVVKYVVKNSHLILSGEEFHFDEPMVTQMLKYFPAGMSARTLAHFGQVCSVGRFQQPDHGAPPDNIQVYGSPLPPLYDLSRIPVPVAIFSGERDRFTNFEDVKWLTEQIPNVIAAEVLKGFGHLDFHWGYKVRSVLFPKMLQAIASEKRKEFGCGGREDPSRQG